MPGDVVPGRTFFENTDAEVLLRDGSWVWCRVIGQRKDRHGRWCVGIRYYPNATIGESGGWYLYDPAHLQRLRLVRGRTSDRCSQGCANWLRYGIQPKNPKPGLRPGYCRGKAHRREYLGYAGRRVLVTRKWSGKTLADHRADRKAWLLAALGIPEDQADRYAWEVVTPSDPDHMPMPRRLLHVLADRARWQAALAQARQHAPDDASESPATGRAA